MGLSDVPLQRWATVALGALLGGSFLYYVVTGKGEDETPLSEEERSRLAEQEAKRRAVKQQIRESFGSAVAGRVDEEMDRLAARAEYDPPIPREQVLSILKDTLKSAPRVRKGLASLAVAVQENGLSIAETYERAKKERPEDAFERAQVSVETFNEALGVFLSRQDAEITPYVSQVLGVTNGDLPASAKEEMKKPKKRLKYRDVIEAEEFKLKLLQKFAEDPWVRDTPALEGKVLWFAAQAWTHAGVARKHNLTFDQLSYALEHEFADREKASPSQTRIAIKGEIQKINVALLSRGEQ